MTTGVSLRAVSKSFGPVRAVNNLDLVAGLGLITTVVGPSGSGKTTLLRLVAGFEVPDGGEVAIAGRIVAGAGRFVPPERRRVGMLFQQLALFPHLDVAGNVGYGLSQRDSRVRKARVAELLELVGLSGYERRYPDQLSGGQAQRVALARALAPRPDVVLLDEPFSSLDVGLRAELRSEVEGILRAESATALLVTHDQDEALAMGDRVVVLLDGRVAQEGTPDDVYRRPTSSAVATFVGEANVFVGDVRGGRVESELGTLAVSASDGPAEILIRPENLDIEEHPEGIGRVLAVEYFGHDQVVAVGLPSGTRVRVRLHARHRLAAGAAVIVHTQRDGLLVFPKVAKLPIPPDSGYPPTVL